MLLLRYNKGTYSSGGFMRKHLTIRSDSAGFGGLFALLLLNCACQAQDSQSAAASCTDFAKTPILFVHGSGLDSSSWESMIETFVRQGFPPEYLLAPDMRPRDGDNVRAAETYISDSVEKLLEISEARISQHDCDEDPPGHVDIVAHSMGAFSARWFTRFLMPEKVRTLVTLAGANHGTDKLCGRSGRGDRQMCPAFSGSGGDSEVQRQLNGTLAEPLDETPFGIGKDSSGRPRIPPDDLHSIAYFTVRLEPDTWIEPSDSAILDGAGGRTVNSTDAFPVTETSGGNYLFLDSTSHDGLPSHPDLIRFVVKLLK